MTLAEISTGNSVIVKKITGSGAFKRRLSEMGFTRGTKVTVLKNAPLKDPIEYKIIDYNISLRRSEANLIEVLPMNSEPEKDEFLGSVCRGSFKSLKQKTEINIALVGNPNAGKTTLFNYLAKQQQHVGNYSGVTVDAKSASLKHKQYTINIVDLPGTYSLSSLSPEEVYVRNHLVNELPDIVLNVVDSGNLHRNLYLTSQLIDMDLQMLIALNMYDEFEKKGDKLDYEHLGAMLGVPMIPTVAFQKRGLKTLLDAVVEIFEGKNKTTRHIHINYGKEIENAIENIQEKIKIPQNNEIVDVLSLRFIAIKSLEKDQEIEQTLNQISNSSEVKNTIDQEIKKIEKKIDIDTHTLVTEAKYSFIRGALKETLKENKVKARDKSMVIDQIITHKWLGFPIFIGLIWLIFQSTFWLGNYPMDWIDSLVGMIQDSIDTYMPTGPFKDLIIDGIIGGVGGVIIFLPNILILFFFISLMEDTGYMARASFIMDKLMHKIGLHGKSFIPLIMGFGCNVPAIMATRTIENKSERYLTILINPFMSCSARLPIYVLIGTAIFPNNAGNIIFLMYIIGVLIAALVAILFKKIFFKKSETPFVMELPPYRVPVLTTSLRHMWNKGSEYLKKMGGIILVASIIVWALGYFPLNNNKKDIYEQNLAQLDKQFKNGEIKEEFKEKETFKLTHNYKIEKQENSYIGRFGKIMEPAIKPLGFDWRIGVAILTGIPAKEIVVSTMGVLFHPVNNNASISDEDTENQDKIANRLKEQVYLSGDKKGQPLFSTITAFSFLLFVLIYFPCIATIIAVKREMNSWKWATFVLFYTTTFAYLISLIFYQTANLLIQ